MANGIVGGVRRASGWSIALGVLMIIAGMIAIGAPLEAGVVVVIVVGWMAIFNGGAQLFYAFSHEAKHRWLEALLGIIYIIAGIYLLMHPLGGLLALTLLIACFLLVYGIFAAGPGVPDASGSGLGMGVVRCHRHHPAGSVDLRSLARNVRLCHRHVNRHQLHRVGRVAPDAFSGGAAADGKSGLVGFNNPLLAADYSNQGPSFAAGLFLWFRKLETMTLPHSYFARSSSTGTLTACCTRVAVVPRNRSARKRCPWVLIATRSHPFCCTHLMISLTGSP